MSDAGRYFLDASPYLETSLALEVLAAGLTVVYLIALLSDAAGRRAGVDARHCTRQWARQWAMRPCLRRQRVSRQRSGRR